MEKIKEGYKETEIGVIPNDWGVTTVKDICNISTGKKNTQDKVDDGQYPFFVRSQKIEKINSYSYDGEAVLTAGDGVGTGKVFHYINGKFDIHQRVYKMTEFKQFYNAYFFYLYFSKYFYDRAKRMSAKTSVDSVRLEMISDMQIPIPPLQEQERIAEILSAVDEHIEKLDKTIEDYQLLKKGMIKKLFAEGIGHTEFKVTEIGRIPKEWKVTTLKDISKNKGDYGIGAKAIDYVKDKPRYLRITDIDDFGNLSYSDIKTIAEDDYDNYLLKDNDLVFARTGNTTGKTYLYKTEDNDLVFAGFLIKFSINEKIANSHFVKQYCQTKSYWDWVKQSSTRSGQPGINSKQYCDIALPLPLLQEQQQISSILFEHDNRISLYQQEREEFIMLKKALMEQLLTGKIRVMQ